MIHVAPVVELAWAGEELAALAADWRFMSDADWTHRPPPNPRGPQPHPLRRDPAALPNDEVIKEFNVKERAGLDQLDGEGDFGGGGGRIARGVVVHDHDGGGVLANRMAKHFSLAP